MYPLVGRRVCAVHVFFRKNFSLRVEIRFFFFLERGGEGTHTDTHTTGSRWGLSSCSPCPSRSSRPLSASPGRIGRLSSGVRLCKTPL